MIGGIFFIALIVTLAALPAYAGWFLGKKYEQSGRMICALLGGQMIVTPAIILFSCFNDCATDDSSLKTIVIYAAMALVISIATFALFEMKRTQSRK